MYISINQFDIVYNKIKTTAQDAQGAETVVVFVGPDIDALCACKLLVSQLKNDWISHRIIPISTYTNLQFHAYDIIQNSADVSSIILLNCGGHMDILNVIPDLLNHQLIYVFESRRPLHLSNLFANDKVWVIDNGHVDQDLEQEKEAHAVMTASLQPQPTNDQDPRFSPHTDSHTDDTTLDHLDQDTLPKMSTHAAKVIVTEYYTKGTYTGMSIAKTMFDLINLLGRAKVYDCWLAAIGITSFVVTEDISLTFYESMLTELDANIARLAGPTSLIHRVAQDWRLPLYRHWSLMDALTYARGPCARLGTWSETGVSKLRYLFAKLGIPLTQSMQPFLHLDKRVQNVIQSNLAANASLIGLNNLEWSILTRTTSLGTLISAADMVSVLHALSLYPNIVQMRDPVSVIADQGLSALGGAHPNNTDAFFVMMAALDKDTYIPGGLEVSKIILPSIMRLAGTQIARKSILKFPKLRYVLIDNTGDDAHHALQSAWGVKELTLALTATLRQSGHVDLPLLVGVLQAPIQQTHAPDAEDGPEQLYLLVGHASAADEDKVRRNQLSLAFQHAAEAVNARHSHDAFDPRVIYVDENDVHEFIEILQVFLQD